MRPFRIRTIIRKLIKVPFRGFRGCSHRFLVGAVFYCQYAQKSIHIVQYCLLKVYIQNLVIDVHFSKSCTICIYILCNLVQGVHGNLVQDVVSFKSSKEVRTPYTVPINYVLYERKDLI